MPEIKMKGPTANFLSRRSSCNTPLPPTPSNPSNPEHHKTHHSNIPSIQSGIAKPRQRSLPRSAALSANMCSDEKSALLSKYITSPSTQVNVNQNNKNNHNNTQNYNICNNTQNFNTNFNNNKNNNHINTNNNNNNNRNTTRSINYNGNSLNRRQNKNNDKNNNVIIVNRTCNNPIMNENNTQNYNNRSNDTNTSVDVRVNNKGLSKTPSIKSKLVRPSTYICKLKQDADNNNNFSNPGNQTSNILYVNHTINKNNNITLENNKNHNNLGMTNKIINANAVCMVNRLNGLTESSKTNQSSEPVPNCNLDENLCNVNYNNNQNNSNHSNQKANIKITNEVYKKAINSVLNSEIRNCSSNNSLNSDASKLKPPRTFASGRSSGLLKPKGTQRGSRQTSPDTTNRSLEDVLDSKTRSKISNGKKAYRSTERILSSEKLNEASDKKGTNKALRVNSIGRGSKSGLKYPGRTGTMKKLMSDVEDNFKNSNLINDHHSRISGSSNDSSGNSYEEKASLEYEGNFDSRVRNKGISKSYSKLVVPGFSIKSQKSGNLKLPKYPNTAFQSDKQKTQNLKNNLQSSKPILNQSISPNQISDNTDKLEEDFILNEKNSKPKKSTTNVKMTSRANSDLPFMHLQHLDFKTVGNDKKPNISSTTFLSNATKSTITSTTTSFSTPPTNTNDQEILSAYDIQPMAPISMTATYFHLNNPLSTTNNFSPFHAQNNLQNANKLSATNDLCKIKSSFHRLNITCLADENNLEAGYMSDGDLLSCKGHQRSSGYVSDGANSLLSLDKHKRSSNNPSVDEEAETKKIPKVAACYADTNSSIYEENFDALSSLSSNDDDQNNIDNSITTSNLSKSNSEHQGTNENTHAARQSFVRNQKIRATLPMKARRAILPLCGFVKKTHGNEEKGSGDDAEIDVEVLFENKVSTMKRNLPGIHAFPVIAKPFQNVDTNNEGMVDLDHLMPEYADVNDNNVSSLPPSHPSRPINNVPPFSNLLETSQKTQNSLFKGIPYSQSFVPNSSHQDFKSFPTSSILSSISTNQPTGGWNREGGTGSKFGMSLEQCYNSGVFQRRNSSNNPSSNFLTLSDISQNDKMSKTNNASSLNTYNPSNNGIPYDIMRNNNSNSHHNEKTLSIASEGEQTKMFTPPKSNPYATMSRSEMAMRIAKRIEMNHADTDNKGYIRSCYATPITNRKSETSMYHPDDSSSIASLPFSKKRHSKNSVPFYSHNHTPFNLDESCYSGLASGSYAGSVASGCSNNYALNRSESYKIRNSRPPSTNENGSTLSLGSCSSLYSTAEEHHAQEIRKLRHELETAHSRVASLNMQLNINENVVNAFEESISNLNQRLHHLTQNTSANAKGADYTDMKSCFDQIGPFKNTIPEDFSSVANLNKQQEIERKKKQKKWLMSFGKSFFKKKSKPISYENEITLEINHHAEDINNNNNQINNNNENNKYGKDVLSISSNNTAHRESLKNEKSLTNSSVSKDASSTANPVEDLEKKLHEREMKLTDVQLEALSSAHQLDQLKDNMAQMEKEMVYLKRDNSRLKQQLVGKSKESSLNEDEEDENEKEVSSPKPALNDARIAEAEKGNDKHKKIILSVQFKHTSHHNSLAFSEVKSKEILFGKMYLTDSMGWETLNRTLAEKFENYLKRVDPEEHLGLSKKSIKSMRVGELSWSLDGPSPTMSPSSYLLAFNNCLSITLKGVHEKCLDALAFETMISKMILERYVGLLMDFKRVIFCGPSGTGKTFLALKLAQYMYDRLANERKDPSLSVFNVDHKSSKELRQYLSNMTRNCIKNSNHNDDNKNNKQKPIDNANCVIDTTEVVDTDQTTEKLTDISSFASNETNHENISSTDKINSNTIVITNISNRDQLPHNNIIVLDNLHHVVSLADVFNGFVSIGNQNSPYVIGTMNQVSSSTTTNLQLHHIFRWVLYSNHIRPVSGFLGRFLRRHLIEREVLAGGGSNTRITDDKLNSCEEGEQEEEEEEELKATIEWMPKVWQHVNKLLEAHNSSEVTLGPQLYLSCPMGGRLMKVWFTDLWNYSIFPYIVEAVKEGIQTYGCRSAWEDPTVWLEKTCPWKHEEDNSLQLLHLRPEDVGYDIQQHQQHKQQQQKQLQLKQQHFQQQSPHHDIFNLHNNSNNSNYSELNKLAFQQNTNNNFNNFNNNINNFNNNDIDNFNNNISSFNNNNFNNNNNINNFNNNNNDNIEPDFLNQPQNNNPETIINMLLKLKDVKSQH